MTITVAIKTFKDGNEADFDGKVLHDSDTGTDNPCHALLDGATGAPISPATAENQAEANDKLESIAANTGAGPMNLALSPAIQAAAYTPGMVVGGKLAFAGAARVNGGGGYVQNAYVAKATTLVALFDLFVFFADPVNSTFTDHQPLDIHPADLGKLAGVIHCEEIIECGTPRLVQMAGQAPVAFNLSANDTTIYVVPVIRGSETYASTDAVTVGLGIAQS